MFDVSQSDLELQSTLEFSIIPKTFLTPLSNKMLVIKAGIHQMFVRIANREDPDQTASSEAV